MASKRKAVNEAASGHGNGSSKRAAVAASAAIDLTSDSDDDNDKSTNAVAASHKSPPVAKLPAAPAKKSPALVAAALPAHGNGNGNGHGAAANGIPVPAPAPALPALQSLPAAAAGSIAVIAPSSSAMSSSSSPASFSTATSSSSSSSTVRPLMLSPTPTGYKQSEAYMAAQLNNQKGIKRLATEFSRLSAVKDYTVSLVDNDLFLWEIKIPFDTSTTLGQDLATYYSTDRCVVIRMAYDSTHPFKAPFVRVRSPRFLKGSSNVMEGGAICMDTFSTIGWSPAMTAEKSILAIQSLLCTAGLNARLDPINHAKEYTEEEGKASYKYVLQAHKEWDQQGSYKATAGTGAAVPLLPPAAVLPAAAARGRGKR